MNTSPQITPRSWLMVALLGFTWGGTFIVTKIALEGGMPPFWLAASRILFASLVMGLIWGALGFPLFSHPIKRSDWPNLLVIGALSSAVPFCFLAWGQQYVTSGFAGVSMAAVALIVLPLAHFTLADERMTRRKTLGFIIGFIGVVVLIGAQAFETTGAPRETAGRISCVMAAACYASTSVMLRRLPQAHPIGLATAFVIISAIIIVPIAWVLEGPPPMPSANMLMILAFLGLIPTAGANFLRVIVVRSAGPVFMSLVNYQVPVWSVILGGMILGEAFPKSLFLAMALILIGVGLSQFGALQRLFKR
ncbi:MAG: DMT family transporter [Sulfitobacter sp.]